MRTTTKVCSFVTLIGNRGLHNAALQKCTCVLPRCRHVNDAKVSVNSHDNQPQEGGGVFAPSNSSGTRPARPRVGVKLYRRWCHPHKSLATLSLPRGQNASPAAAVAAMMSWRDTNASFHFPSSPVTEDARIYYFLGGSRYILLYLGVYMHIPGIINIYDVRGLNKTDMSFSKT